MNKEDFYRELGNISPEFIEEAENPVPVKHRSPWKKFVPIAAVIAVAAVVIGNSPSAQAAIKKLFSFIPGIGISEETDNDETVLYSAKNMPMKAEEEYAVFSVDNVYVSEKYIDVAYSYKLYIQPFDGKGVTPDSTSEETVEALNRHMQSELDRTGLNKYFTIEDTPYMPNIMGKPDIFIDGKAVEIDSVYGGGSLEEQSLTARVKSDGSLVEKYGSDIPITVKFGEHSFDIELKPIETYEAPELIGPTDSHNGISITAEPRFEDDTLFVKFYPINNSEFTQVFEYKTEDGYPFIKVGEKIITADFLSGDGSEFEFDVSELTEEERENIVLHLPAITVLNQEEHELHYNIADDGTITFDEKVSMDYADMIIHSMKYGSEDMENAIEISYEFVPKAENISVAGIRFERIDNKHCNIGSWTDTSEEILVSAFESDDVNMRKSSLVYIASPEYILHDEYIFNL